MGWFKNWIIKRNRTITSETFYSVKSSLEEDEEEEQEIKTEFKDFYYFDSKEDLMNFDESKKIKGNLLSKEFGLKDSCELNRFRLNSDDHSSNIPNIGEEVEEEEKAQNIMKNYDLQSSSSFLPPDQVDLAEEISSNLKEMQFEIAMINSEILRLLV